MIAYDKIKLENTFLVEEGEKLLNEKFISKEDFQNLKAHLPVLNSSSFFIRIGFFMLGCFLVSSITGFLLLLFSSITNGDLNLQFYVNGIFVIVGSEIFASNGYYKHGLNDAFVLSIILFLTAAVGSSSNYLTPAFVILIAVGFLAGIRYVHPLSILIGCIGIVALCAFLIIKHKIVNQAFLPFIGLFLGILFFYVNRLLNNDERFWLYKNGFFLVKIFSLLLVYFSMNYLVVRELSVILMNITIEKGKDIPLATIFYFLTFAIPTFYISFGLAKKDRVFLLIGLFTFGFGIFTIRYYYAILPIETVLVIGGILLFAVSYFAIRKWRNNMSGLTFLPDRGTDNSLILNAQAFLIAGQSVTKIPRGVDSKMPFGGGGFSGGGAGDSF